MVHKTPPQNAHTDVLRKPLVLPIYLG